MKLFALKENVLIIPDSPLLLQMNVDLREYKVEEVTVKINKTRRVITITAEHKSQFESYSSYREFTLPAGAPDSNPNAIDAVLNSNGILTITGPCTPQQMVPAAITDITDDVTNKLVKQNTAVDQQNTSIKQQNTSVVEQNTSVQQNKSVQQQNTSVQQQQQKNTTVQQVQDTSVEQHQCEQQIVQKSRYTKITRETFTSSTMTSLDITEANEGDVEEPLSPEPDTQIDPVPQEMEEDEDGNLVAEVNIKDYRAEEITIKASKTTITIVGRKDDNSNRQFVKTIRVPSDLVVTPDTIRSVLDKSRKVITIIIIKKKKVTTTTTEQITDDATEEETSIEQKRVQQQKQQQVQQRQETVEETQRKIQTEQQVNQQRLVQENQTQQQINQQKQQVQQQEQRLQQNTTNTTTTSKRTIKTTTTTVESLQKLGYNFENATTQTYTGDPKFFERATPIVDYKPEELEVKIAMPWVIVEGKQEMTAENGWRSKQFTKMFTVPEGVKQENIRLELNDAGDVVNCTALIG